jgi:hypothetical protein
MNEHSSEWPLGFEAFRSYRTRFLDRMAADAVLYEIESGRHSSDHGPKERRVEPIVVEGQLSLIVEERRMILGYFSPHQRDLADVIREGLDARVEAFGLIDAGEVRITVEFVASGDIAAPEQER